MHPLSIRGRVLSRLPLSVPPSVACVRDREQLLSPIQAAPVCVHLERDTASGCQLAEPGHMDTEQTGRMAKAKLGRRCVTLAFPRRQQSYPLESSRL